MNPVVVIGLGNEWLGDEGIGLRVVRVLAESAARFPGVDFLELGTATMKVIHAIAGRRKAVFIDCAYMKEAPGTIRRFHPEAAASAKKLGGMSGHESDLLATLDLARRVDDCLPKVVIFGIQPEQVALGDLSPGLAARLAEYAENVARELEDTGTGPG